MSGWDDLPHEMPIGTIDEDTTDRLLAGRIHPDDAPPGYAGVARILQADTPRAVSATAGDQ